MILTICGIVMLICGLCFLLLPKKYLISEKSLKNGKTEEQALKTMRTGGIVFVIIGILSLFVW